jgi:hypothetical protein
MRTASWDERDWRDAWKLVAMLAGYVIACCNDLGAFR